MKQNEDIRKEAKQANVKLWEIAEAYGICDCNFSRKLRRELPPDDKAKIRQIIHDLAAN